MEDIDEEVLLKWIENYLEIYLSRRDQIGVRNFLTLIFKESPEEIINQILEDLEIENND